jgi:RNA polymerase sporulation-specific sigma factor
MVSYAKTLNTSECMPLPYEEVMRLLKSAQSGDSAAVEKLVNSNLKLVMSIASRFLNSGYELDDLFQVGSIGLIKAIRRFDTSSGLQFSTYAVPLIIGEIRRYLRDDSPIRVSRSIKELAYKAGKVKEALSATLGREATIAEIANELGVSSDRVVEAFEATSTLTSLHQPVYRDDGDELLVVDQLAVSEGGTEESRLVERMSLKQVIDRLEKVEKQVIFLRFLQDKGQVDVAKALEISQPQVSRIERRALCKIRAMLEVGHDD